MTDPPTAEEESIPRSVEPDKPEVRLSVEEARELADHLADADLDRRNAKDRDPGHTELFEWSKELRGRANDAQEG